MLGYQFFASLLALMSAQGTSALLVPEWEVVASAEGSSIVRATVIFHQPKIQQARSLLEEISDPMSERFGEHLDDQDLVSCFVPSPVCYHLNVPRRICSVQVMSLNERY